MDKSKRYKWNFYVSWKFIFHIYIYIYMNNYWIQYEALHSIISSVLSHRVLSHCFGSVLFLEKTNFILVTENLFEFFFTAFIELTGLYICNWQLSWLRYSNSDTGSELRSCILTWSQNSHCAFHAWSGEMHRN